MKKLSQQSKKLMMLHDEAFGACQNAHNRMRHELAIYRNDGYASRWANYATSGSLAGRINTITRESLNPEIQKGIIRLISAFMQQASRIELLPDISQPSEAERQGIEDLKQWSDMMEDIDRENERLKTAVMHNNIMGHAITKAVWDPHYQVPRLITVHPLAFAADSGATQTNLQNANWLVHNTKQPAWYIKKWYPEFELDSPKWFDLKDGYFHQYKLTEIHMRRQVADWIGIKDLKKTNREIIIATLIDGHLARLRPSPYNYPDFTWATWRNFPDIYFGEDGTEQSQKFFGHGYASFMWPQQKWLDDLYANFVLMLRRIAIGRILSKKGALDLEQVFTGYGINIEVDSQIADIRSAVMAFPQDNAPAWVKEIFNQTLQSIKEMLPSLSEVFVGESPTSNASGKLANTLQYAAHNQLSDNIRDFNEYRLDRKRLQISLIQQFAERPRRPHLWRRGVDFPHDFREETRHQGYHAKMPDATSMPHTPAGKLEVVERFGALGWMLPIDEILSVTGFDKGFGWKPDMFQGLTMPDPSGQQQTPQNTFTT